jgi:hypothetical protein
MTLTRRTLVASSLGFALAGLGALRARRALPLFAVRDRPLVLEAGRIGRQRPLVQHVAALHATITRIEVAVAGDVAPGLERGELRVRGPAGVLAAARGVAAPGFHRDSRHVRFAFDPPIPAGGVELAFELRGPSEAGAPPLVPYLRPRGGLGERHDFGDEPLADRSVWRLLRADRERFSGLAVPIQAAAAEGGPVVLELFATQRPIEIADRPQPRIEGDLPPIGSEPVRRVVLPEVPRLVLGHLPLRFAPIEDSFGRTYAARLVTPRGVIVAANFDGFAFVPLSGDVRPREPFHGLELDGVELAGCDLALSAWGEPISG